MKPTSGVKYIEKGSLLGGPFFYLALKHFEDVQLFGIRVGLRKMKPQINLETWPNVFYLENF